MQNLFSTIEVIIWSLFSWNYQLNNLAYSSVWQLNNVTCENEAGIGREFIISWTRPLDHAYFWIEDPSLTGKRQRHVCKNLFSLLPCMRSHASKTTISRKLKVTQKKSRSPDWNGKMTLKSIRLYTVYIKNIFVFYSEMGLFLVKTWETQVIISMSMLTLSSERIFNPWRYTDNKCWKLFYEIVHDIAGILRLYGTILFLQDIFQWMTDENEWEHIFF